MNYTVPSKLRRCAERARRRRAASSCGRRGRRRASCPSWRDACGDAGLLVDVQRVEVGAQADRRRSAAAVAQHADDAGPGEAACAPRGRTRAACSATNAAGRAFPRTRSPDARGGDGASRASRRRARRFRGRCSWDLRHSSEPSLRATRRAASQPARRVTIAAAFLDAMTSAASPVYDLARHRRRHQRRGHRARRRRAAASRCCWSRRTTSPRRTSSWSTKLIHGGLRYLEYYEFRLVRESLAEREVLLRQRAAHRRAAAFVLPHEPHLRPAWMIRAGPVPLRPPRRRG